MNNIETMFQYLINTQVMRLRVLVRRMRPLLLWSLLLTLQLSKTVRKLMGKIVRKDHGDVVLSLFTKMQDVVCDVLPTVEGLIEPKLSIPFKTFFLCSLY